jgi:hypothetical protein
MKRWIALLAATWSLAAAPLATPLQHRRPADQTFLTGPEWFLVFSPEEYAAWLPHHPPSQFPFYGHIGQFWRGYRAVTLASHDYPANYGYHLMIMVIGLSTTVEYGLKGLYETLIGQFSEQLGSDTQEDRLAAATAARYVTFIKVRPWYEFDFLTPLKQVWTGTGIWGAHPFRKWERKYFLTSEYLAKAAYGWALGGATHATYERPIEQTYVVADSVASRLPKDVELRSRNGGTALLALPRYQAFTQAAGALANDGANFQEIAGNRGPVMVTVVASAGNLPDSGGKLIFSQPILTRPGQARYAIAYRVSELAVALRRFAARAITVEHIYDF